MPQLDFSTYLSQVFWLAVTFGALYLLVVRKALPSIGGAIEHRRARIADDMDEARRLKEAAEQALDAYEQSISEARREAHEMVASAKSRISAELSEERQRIEEKLAAKIAKAETQVRKRKEEALAELDGVIGELAAGIIEKAAGVKATKTELKKALEKVMG